MEFPGISRKIIGMCYGLSQSTSSYSAAPNALTLRVPFIAQKHVNLCSDATAMMIVQAWGYQLNRATDTNPRGMLTGKSISSHMNLTDTGVVRWETQTLVSIEALLNLLASKGPIGAAMDSKLGGHCVAIIGVFVNNGEVVIHDPWSGPFKIRKFTEFKRHLVDVTYLKSVGYNNVDTSDAAWAK